MSLVEGISEKTAIAAVDALADKLIPEIDPDLQHFAATLGETIVKSLEKVLAGKTLTITIKLGE